MRSPRRDRRQQREFPVSACNLKQCGRLKELVIHAIWYFQFELNAFRQLRSGPSLGKDKSARVWKGGFFRPVRHAEARTEVLGKEDDSVLVLLGILLHEIFHGLNQHPLAFYIAGIIFLDAFSVSAAACWIGENGDRENFSHGTTSDAQLSRLRCRYFTLRMRGPPEFDGRGLQNVDCQCPSKRITVASPPWCAEWF